MLSDFSTNTHEFVFYDHRTTQLLLQKLLLFSSDMLSFFIVFKWMGWFVVLLAVIILVAVLCVDGILRSGLAASVFTRVNLRRLCICAVVVCVLAATASVVYADGCVDERCNFMARLIDRYRKADYNSFIGNSVLIDSFFLSGIRNLLNSDDFSNATIKEKRRILAVYAGVLNQQARAGRISWYGVLPGLLSGSRMTAEQFTTMLDLFRTFIDSSVFENRTLIDAIQFKCNFAI